ncbi:potassium transporter, partial [Francisella tularensis subsp. holarctica]|nr:potassium transporter [Francisella tularensis subsp. holarctica]
IIVLSEAIRPLLGVGDIQFAKAVVSVQWKDDKLAPNISISAKALCRVYLYLTYLCFISYILDGVEPFTAI